MWTSTSKIILFVILKVYNISWEASQKQSLRYLLEWSSQREFSREEGNKKGRKLNNNMDPTKALNHKKKSYLILGGRRGKITGLR